MNASGRVGGHARATTPRPKRRRTRDSQAFWEGNEWPLFDGHDVTAATIADVIGRVDPHMIRFAEGDILLCDGGTVQGQGVDGLTSDHAVTRLVDHKPARDPIPLPFSEP